ncbi:MAG: 1-deoxy-D-xylulose-5-phosphate synthase, partial [Candidatus Omnitrophica bacterium]|nr:1-deoxy-D-xylulose-5-phosphate synthase [Candidatus Omnitrophota bacterium]
MSHWTAGMRDSFFQSLYEEAKKNRNIILVTSDTGAICHDEFKEKIPDQYINVGIAEQNMIGLAAGLAQTGKIVYVYAIVPFATMRCYEQIRVDLCCMNLPVSIVGIGAGLDYSTLGATHHGTEDIALMRCLPNMEIYSPADGLMADLLARQYDNQAGPRYIRLDREGLPLVYENDSEFDLSKGFSVLSKSKELYIVATGRMVYSALQVAKELSLHSIEVGVIDLFRIKPLNKEEIWETVKGARCLITLEEHFMTGGIGT